MPINYYPNAGQVLKCSFKGFKEPEMNKVRPVIVTSPKLPYRAEIITIVPVSLTPPEREYPYSVRLSKNYHPLEKDDLPCWAKCDMVLNVARHRLNGFKIDRRRYLSPSISQDDLEAVRMGVIYGLGLNDLIFNKN